MKYIKYLLGELVYETKLFFQLTNGQKLSRTLDDAIHDMQLNIIKMDIEMTIAELTIEIFEQR